MLAPFLRNRYAILEQRQISPFKDWRDVTLRLKGIGPKRASMLSDDGLRVNGLAWPAEPTSQGLPLTPTAN